MAADKKSPASMRRVDSLNELAFRQKRTDVPNALNNLALAQNLATSVGYQRGLGTSFLYEAGIFYQNGYDKKALSTYYKALQLFKTLNDTFNIAFASQQIALSLQQDGDYAEAGKLYNESLRVYTLMNKKSDIVNVKNALAVLYISMKKYNQAQSELRQALSTAKSISYAYGEKKAYYNLGLLDQQLGRMESAASYYRTALAMDETEHDKYGMALSQLKLAELLVRSNQNDSAVQMVGSAYRNASAVSAYNLLKDAASQMISLYRSRDDIRQAAQWQDSLVKILQTQINNEKVYAQNFIDVIKNQDIQKINAEKVQQEQLLVITIGTFILIIVAVLAVLALVNYQRQRFFGRELKQKTEIIEKNAASLDRLNKEISNQNLLLEEDNKTKNKLLSIISHDLRTPLVNTKGILNLVNQGMVPKDESDKLLLQLETQYIGTTSLLDNLLFWIKGQMNGQQNDKARVNLYLLIRALEDEQRLPLQKKDITLHNNIDKSITIFVEKEMMRIVCRNLISNSIKFTNEGGSIELNSRADDEFLYLTVKDSGIGMSKETIEKINAKVYYNTMGTAYEKGSGFGLMLCRDLIHKHGGELLVESEPGNGTAFTVKLPLEEVPALA
jgi:signal transduction histidine kinase